MTEAIEMGFKSLHSRTEAMSEGLSGLDKNQNKTNKGFNDIMDLVRDMRAKVQDLIRMQDSISNQFKTVDKIMMGNTASDYEVKEYVAPKTRSPPKKLSLSEDEEDYKPAPRAPIKFDELSDEEAAAPVSATTHTVEIEEEAPAAEEAAAEEPAVEEAAAEEAVAEEAAAEEPAGEADAVADEEADLAAAEEAARKAEEEEQLRREEEELAALEAEEAELLRLEEEEALRKEEEELRRLEQEEEEEARRIAEEELRKLEEEEAARKKAEEEELKKKEEEEKKKGKFPPPKKTPGKLNKFQTGGKNKVVFK